MSGMSGMSKPITVACVLWMGDFSANNWVKTKYSPKWVERLKNMVERNLSIPYDFVCLTNVDNLNIPGVRAIPLRYNLRGWWTKLELCREDLPITPGKVLFLDLDVILVKSILPLITNNPSSSFTICKPFGNPKPKEKGKIYGYNSSVMLYDYPEVSPIWEHFLANPSGFMKKYRGHQDFLKGEFSNFSIFPDKWIDKLGHCIDRNGELHIPEELKVLLSMPMKNEEAVKRYKELEEIWQ